MTKKQFFSVLQSKEDFAGKIFRGYFRLPGQSIKEAKYIYGRLPDFLCSKDKEKELKGEMFACFKKEFEGHLDEVINA